MHVEAQRAGLVSRGDIGVPSQDLDHPVLLAGMGSDLDEVRYHRTHDTGQLGSP